MFQSSLHFFPIASWGSRKFTRQFKCQNSCWMCSIMCQRLWKKSNIFQEHFFLTKLKWRKQWFISGKYLKAYSNLMAGKTRQYWFRHSFKNETWSSRIWCKLTKMYNWILHRLHDWTLLSLSFIISNSPGDTKSFSRNLLCSKLH